MTSSAIHLANLQEAIGEALADRECLVFRDRRLTWRDLTGRTRRLANFLLGHGLGARRERDGLERWESGQDHLALYLYNGNEYVEGMLGACKARLAAFNVNYRYVDEELVYLLRDARARAIVYHASFAPTLARIRAELPDLEVFLQVGDDSGEPLLDGAIDYEAALAASSAERPDVVWSPDDLYILYTGGTTGMPKGVLWRQEDIVMTAMGGRNPDGSEVTVADVVERAKGGGMRVLPTPPLMHGAAHWATFFQFHHGNPVVFQSETRHLDADDVWSTVEREKIVAMLIVGDAFGRPLLDQLERKTYDLSTLSILVTGGAALSAPLKQEFLDKLPSLMIVDAVGSSETGAQAQHMSTRQSGVSTGTFRLLPGSCVLSEDRTRVLEAGDDEVGWFAQTGRVPLGYLGDEEKTRRTFPVIEGVRYSIPGDRARLRADGMLELLGRDSVTINSGGEKIFAEEIEHALKQHPAVYDAVVCGRPSPRWGQEVVAIVSLREGRSASEADLLAECSKHVARYKLPKAFLFRERVFRSPSGKADYRWARAEAAGP